MNKYHVILLCLVVILLNGCDGDKKQLSGKVTFSDGKPVTYGKVVFSNSTFLATGNIQKDGSYRMGSTGEKDGVPPGEYMVSVTGVSRADPNNSMVYLSLCDEKYNNAQSSGLKCTIPAPGNKFDITLEPHPTNYP